MTTGSRILLLSHAADNPNGGASRVFHLLAQGLEDLGHEVTLLHLEDMELPSNRVARLVAARTLMPVLLDRAGRKQDPSAFDVVLSPSGLGYRLYDALKTSDHRPLLVNLIHGLAKYDHAAYMTESQLGHWLVTVPYRLVTGPAQVRWDDLGIKASDVTVVQNLRDLSDVRDTLGGEDRVRLIPPAVHPELLDSSSDIVPPEDRAAAGILWFGTWEARKGAHHVPGAFREIRRSHPEATLTLGGTGKPEHEMREFFSPEDRSSVRVLPRISNAEQAAIFNESSIFLFPSLSEGFGLALAEAMCFGLAAVTTSTAFGGDYLTDQVDARVVPPTSAHLSRAVVDLVEDPAKRSALAARGRAIARTFTLERSAAAYSKMFEDERALSSRATTPSRKTF
ncbi:glycosyltransferase family 4 protein [Frondihabitans cladoniiphilus]|uniref:Glycosyl transferase family 1 domain-containing protein n=1 Tax=Frondihabitans cladoniiphilus TaxID=715785 RepID=A0ABP8VXI3_9MICO